MSQLHLERAVYRLSVRGLLTEGQTPDAALAALLQHSSSPDAVNLSWVDLRVDLEPDERDIVERGDVAEMYRRGVHPIIIRNFAGVFGIDYRRAYEQAGLQ